MSVALLEERPTRRGGRPPLSRTRKWLIGSTLAAYAVVVIGVLTTSWLVQLDWQLVLFRPYKQWPEFYKPLEIVVVLGQRGPTALIVLSWLSWRGWRNRDLRPLLVLGLALLLLNVSVGAVKHGLGRLGPHYATSAGSSEMFSGGDIFPSGHTANAVVTWGVLAYLATKHRRTGAVITAIFAFTVGMTTIYLGTHWVTDVIAGWTAGILVMLVLPMFEPLVARADTRIRELWAWYRPLPAPVPSAPLPSAPLPSAAARGAGADPAPVLGTVVLGRAGSGARQGTTSAAPVGPGVGGGALSGTAVITQARPHRTVPAGGGQPPGRTEELGAAHRLTRRPAGTGQLRTLTRQPPSVGPSSVPTAPGPFPTSPADQQEAGQTAGRGPHSAPAAGSRPRRGGVPARQPTASTGGRTGR